MKITLMLLNFRFRFNQAEVPTIWLEINKPTKLQMVFFVVAFGPKSDFVS